MKKTYSETELLIKAQAYCSAAEHCPSELRTKLKAWGCSDQLTADSIINDLIQERFIDETRYCIAFARDKCWFNSWGKLKISLALKAKGLSPEAIQTGIDSIDEEDYSMILRRLLEQKAKTLNCSDERELKAKLLRYAYSKGFIPPESFPPES